MVSRRVSGDTSIRFIFAQGENRVAGTTNLESSGFLEILTFEKDFSAAHSIDRGGGQDRGSMDEGFDPPVRLSDVFQRWLCSHRLPALSYGERQKKVVIVPPDFSPATRGNPPSPPFRKGGLGGF
jgi:hypothetical protein